MARRIKLANHLSEEELAKRYRSEKEAVGRSHWLLSNPCVRLPQNTTSTHSRFTAARLPFTLVHLDWHHAGVQSIEHHSPACDGF
ncbi:MAG TPA: hypothetical protein VKQ72_07935 [Aggregatilineales bacterium]|nr:hypothetical protein [Aggregatilineales bacterium]